MFHVNEMLMNFFFFFLPNHNMMRTQSTPQYNSAAQTWQNFGNSAVTADQKK